MAAPAAAELLEMPFVADACLAPADRAIAATGVVIRLRWDDWLTSQLSTSMVAIMLGERMGFEVRLVVPEGPTLNVYRDVATRAYDAAIEVWPGGKAAEFNAWASTNGSAPAVAHYYPDVRTHVGIYETCDRSSSTPEQIGDCFDAVARTLPRRLVPLLDTAAGRTHLAATQLSPSADAMAICASEPELGCDADGVYRPAVCREPGASCSVSVLHVSPHWTTGVIEAFAEVHIRQ